jgi:hypothetical protein
MIIINSKSEMEDHSAFDDEQNNLHTINTHGKELLHSFIGI